jgi:hypothetical protein
VKLLVDYAVSPRRWVQAAVMVATLSAWLLYQLVWLPGRALDAAHLILHDQGTFLYAVQRLAAGERLYADLAWQYGPWSVGWYVAAATIGGNSAVTLLVAEAVGIGLAWSVMVSLAARRVGFWPAWIVGTVALLPAMTGPCLLSMYTGPHAAVEAMFLALIALWIATRPPDLRHGLGLGVLLGGLRLVRFGPDAVAGLTALVLWGVVAWGGQAFWPAARQWLRTAVGVAIGYGVVGLAFAGWLYLRVSPAAWRDQLWPSYVLHNYQQSFASRWPDFGVVRDWGEKWLPILVAGILVLITVIVLGAREHRRPGAVAWPVLAGISFFPVNFFVGAFVLFHSPAWLHANAWMIWPAAALPAFWPWRGRWLAMAGLVPAMVLYGSGWMEAWKIERDRKAEAMLLPNGQQLWFHGSEARDFDAVARFIAGHPRPLLPGQRRKVLVFLAGSGVHFYFNLDRVGRHAWYMRDFVRPWEEDQVARDLGAHELFLPFWAAEAKPDGTVGFWVPLPGDKANRFLGRLTQMQRLAGAGLGFEISPPTPATPRLAE